MKIFVALLLSAVGWLSACASAPEAKTPQELIVGEWRCTAEDVLDYRIIFGPTDNMVQSFDGGVSLRAGRLEGKLEFASSYLLDGPTLHRKFKSLGIQKFVIDGEPISPEELPALEQMFVHLTESQPTFTVLALDTQRLVLAAHGDGALTSCTREDL